MIKHNQQTMVFLCILIQTLPLKKLTYENILDHNLKQSILLQKQFFLHKVVSV